MVVNATQHECMSKIHGATLADLHVAVRCLSVRPSVHPSIRDVRSMQRSAQDSSRCAVFIPKRPIVKKSRISLPSGSKHSLFRPYKDQVDRIDMAERWLPALRPWCVHLAGCATLTAERDPRDESGASWVLSVALDSDSADALLTSREALALLALVARVDLRGYAQLLADFCGCARASDAASELRAPPRVLFESPPPSPPDAAAAFDAVALRRLLLPAAPPSAECRAAARRVLRLMTPAMRDALAQNAAFRTRATLAFVPPDRLRGGPRAYLEAVRATVRALADHEALYVRNSAGGEEDLLLDPLALELERGELDLTRVKPRDVAACSDVIADLVALGVQPFPELDLSPPAVPSTLPITRIGSIFVGLTNTESTCAVQERLPRVFSERNSTLAVVSRYAEPTVPYRSHRRRLQAFYSALAAAQELKTLRVANVLINDSEASRFKKWQWLSYALLSNEAQSSVESLTLEDSTFGPSDLRAIMSVLEFKFPISKLMDRESLVDYFSTDNGAGTASTVAARASAGQSADAFAELFAKNSAAAQYFQRSREQAAAPAVLDDPLAVDEDLGSVELTEGTVVFVNPFDAAEETPESLVLTKDASFRIIRNDARCQWIDIVVPGFGYCAVPRVVVKNIVMMADDDTEPRKSSLETGYRGSIKSLTLRFTTLEPTVDLLLPLFRYIGPHLEAVDLSHLVTLSPEELCRILSLCPRLTGMDFNVSDPRGGLVALAQAYDEGRCQAEELCLVECQTGQNIIPFVAKLGDQSSGIASKLRRLTFDSVHEDEVLPDDVLTAIAAMLKTNNTLEYVELDVFPEVQRSTWLNLIATDGKVLPVVKTPLPLEARLAFLSVVQQRGGSTEGETESSSNASDSANGSVVARRSLGDLRGLDRDVIRLVFLFAAEPKTRTVCLQVFELEAEDEFEDIDEFDEFGEDGEGEDDDGGDEDDSEFEDVTDDDEED